MNSTSRMNRSKRKGAKKFAILVALLCVVAVSAFTTAIVFAATNIKGSGTTNITYSVTGAVKGTMDATYKLGDAEETSWGSVSYDGSEEDSATKALASIANINFSKTNRSVVYKFVFKADTGTSATKNGYSALLSFSLGSGKSADNVKVYYSTDGTTWGSPITIGSDEVTLSSSSLDVRSNSGTAAYVKVEMVSELENVNFGGTFGWTLTNNNA